MADRQGGKVGPGDPGTKQDQPSEQAAAPDAKVAQEAAEAKAEQAAVEAPEEPKEPKAPSESPAEGTAAAETKVDKAAAAVAKDATANEAEAEEPEAEAEEPEAEAEEQPAAETPAKPAARARRSADDGGAAPPVVRAQAKYVRTSARKARLVCDHIRGKSVDEARAILAYTPRAVAKDWAKLLNSAVANAEHNHELLGDDLIVQAAYADEGPTLKRFQPRAMGRATRIRKRTSHLTITLTPKG